MTVIENYITQINEYPDSEISFLGDGAGDFEKLGRSTTKECLVDYIEFCQNQILLAKQCLQNFEEYTDDRR